MNQTELMNLLRERCPTIAPIVADAIRPCVNFTAVADGAGDAPVGAGRFAGDADLPPDTPWPVDHQNRPLDLIMQLNLADLPPHGLDLPKQGLLSFFYDADRMPGGFDEGDETGSRILYFPTLDGLRRVPDPAKREYPLTPCLAVPSPGLSLPSPGAPLFRERDVPEKEFMAYYQTIGDLAIGAARLGGHADPIQGEVEEEVLWFSEGVYRGREFDAEKYQRVAHKSAEWAFLLQVESDQTIGAMWGDMGRIYYMLRHEDMAARNFDPARLVFQCS